MTDTNGKMDRRRAVGMVMAGAAAGTMTACTASRSELHAGNHDGDGDHHAAKGGAERTGIFPDTVKAADVGYSPAILAKGDRMLFISGQGPKDYDADPETQIRQTFENLQTVLEAAGATWANVTLIRSFFVNMKRDLPLYRKVRKEFLVKPYPASTAVGTTELAIEGLQIEFELTAVL